MPDPNPTARDREKHYGVLEEAYEIYVERSKDRGQLWKEFDSTDAVLHIKSKAARVFDAESRADTFAEDDALDLINYAVFYIRHKRAVGLPKEEK